jgi:hypothetical protein
VGGAGSDLGAGQTLTGYGDLEEAQVRAAMTSGQGRHRPGTATSRWSSYRPRYDLGAGQTPAGYGDLKAEQLRATTTSGQGRRGRVRRPRGGAGAGRDDLGEPASTGDDDLGTD